MSPRFWPRLGRTLALGAAPLTAHTAAAQEPAAFPSPAQPKFVDVYHGTTKVGVMMLGRPPVQRVMPAPTSAVARPTITETRTEIRTETHIPDEVAAAVRTAEHNQRLNTATADLLARLEERLKVSSEPRAVFPVTYTFPVAPPPPAFYPPYPQAAPWLMSPPPAHQLVPIPAAPAPAAAPAQQQQQQPQIVVIRESGEPRPMMMPAPMPAAEARGVTLSTETLLGFGVGVVGLGFGFAAYLRSGRVAAVALKPPAPPSQMAPDGVMLMGKYNAGPRPAPAEKFELGPTYQDVQEEKKKAEAESQQAVLEFILSQNLALHAEIAGPDAAEPEPDLAGPDLVMEAAAEPDFAGPDLAVDAAPSRATE
jgi:hypothetical protein